MDQQKLSFTLHDLRLIETTAFGILKTLEHFRTTPAVPEGTQIKVLFSWTHNPQKIVLRFIESSSPQQLSLYTPFRIPYCAEDPFCESPANLHHVPVPEKLFCEAFALLVITRVILTEMFNTYFCECKELREDAKANGQDACFSFTCSPVL